jgi:branched-chain amino acid transport system ATP-binding protein
MPDDAWCRHCDGAALRENEDVKEFYLGLGFGPQELPRDQIHRRRKRWLA